MSAPPIKISIVLQVAIESIALMTVFHWWFSDPIADEVSTKINAAFCTLLVSVQLRMVKAPISKLIWSPLLLITIIISTLSLIENIFLVNLGIDTFLFFRKHELSFHLMSSATAVSIILFSAIILLISFNKAKFTMAAIIISYIVGFNSLVVIVGRIYAISLKSFPYYVYSESLLTASLFLMLVIVISMQNHGSSFMKILLRAREYNRSFISRVSKVYILSILMIGGIVILNAQMGLLHRQFGIAIISSCAILLLLILSFYNSKNLKYVNRQLHLVNKKLESSNALLNKNLKTNQYLVKEIHHRIKNNLQMLNSILSVKSTRSGSTELKEFISETKLKIQFIGQLHEQLLQSKELNGLNIKTYLLSITDNLIKGNSIFVHTVRTEIEDLDFDMDKALCLGFITNEIVTNIIKHAYPDRPGVIEISLTKHGDSYFYSVKDYGEGILKENSNSQLKTFGQELIAIFVQQLGGTLKVTHANGTQFSITFPVLK